MTIAEALKKYSNIEADLLLGHVLKQSKEFLYMNGVQKLTAAQQKSFETFAAKRKDGMPVAYLLGYKYFYGLKFKVNKSVLIPRPETEWLVDETLKILKTKRSSVKVLDVGTGSGCIAISIAKNTDPKRVKVFASDISAAALKVAEENTKTNNAKVVFARRDLLQGVAGKFDVIIANLPYVPVSDYKKFYKNLKHEPKLALTDDTDDFILLKKFLNQAPSQLSKTGVLLLEVDPLAIKPLKKVVRKTKKLAIMKVVKDINKLDRFVILRKL